MIKSSYEDFQHQDTETGVRVAAGAVVYFISGVPQSDPCSAHRLHRYAHETRSKDPG